MILALIPAYNEEKTIGTVVKISSKYVDRVIVIDDGSSDNTYQIAKKAGAIVIRHKVNKGKGDALKTGFRYILKNFKKFQKVVIVDADMQYNPNEIPKLLKEKDSNIVMGFRNWKEVPFRHRIPNFIWRKLFNIIFSSKLKDVACGFYVLDKKAIKKILKDIKGGYLVEASILISAIRNKLKIRQIQVKVTYKKKAGIKKGVRMFLGITIFLLKEFLKLKLMRKNY